MKTTKGIMVLLVSLGCFLLSAAALGLLLPSTAHAANYSMFLEDYPMTPDLDRTGAMIYRKPGFDVGAYDKVMIEPITIFIHPNSKYKGIKPDEMKTLTDSFYNALVDALEPDYPVVSKPGAGVILLRLAITDVSLKKDKLRVLDFTPIGAVFKAGKVLLGKNISLTDAVVEGEMIDTLTGEVTGVFVDAEPYMVDEKAKPSWKAILQSFKFYGERLRQRLDEAHAGSK